MKMYLVLVVLTTAVSEISAGRYKSCEDVKRDIPNAVSGTYIISADSGTSASVYCDFYGTCGYTFVPKYSLSSFNDLDHLYNVDDVAMIRIKYKNQEQHSVSLQQMSMYEKSYALNFQHSQAEDFSVPLNDNLKPYIYVGMLPNEVSTLVSNISSSKPVVKGYRAGGTDHAITSCAQSPNNYIAFLSNPSNLPENTHWDTCCNVPFMRKWIEAAQLVPSRRYLPSNDYFYQFEMQMGGCGYLTSSHVASTIAGVAVGFPFSLSAPDGHGHE